MANDQSHDPLKLVQAFLAGWNNNGDTPRAASPASDSLADRLAQALGAISSLPDRNNAGLEERLDRIETLLTHMTQRLDELAASQPPAGGKRKKKH